MKQMTQEIKRMLEALAFASAGDNLTRRQKSRIIAGTPAPLAKPETDAVKKQRPQIGLYLGSELSTDVMQYVVQTCTRLNHDLTVLSFQSEGEVQALLDPYRNTLAEAGIEMLVTILAGEPPAALVHALRRRSDIAFLICSESGYLGRGLMQGSVHQDSIPVPVVLVAVSEAAGVHQPKEETATRIRAA